MVSLNGFHKDHCESGLDQGVAPSSVIRIRERELDQLSLKIAWCCTEEEFRILCKKGSEFCGKYAGDMARTHFVGGESYEKTGYEIVHELLISALVQRALFKEWPQDLIPSLSDDVDEAPVAQSDCSLVAHNSQTSQDDRLKRLPRSDVWPCRFLSKPSRNNSDDLSTASSFGRSHHSPLPWKQVESEESGSDEL